MLKISWKDKVPNAEVLKRVGEKEQYTSGKLCNRNWRMLKHTYEEALAYEEACSGRNALVILEGKIRGKRAKGRPRRMWFDDVRQWTMLKDYNEVKRNAEDRETWRAITR